MIKRTAFASFVLAASLLLSACGALTKLAYSNAAMAYSNLAPMAAWMVDDYVDLSGGQKDWVRERITRVMQWHRSHELPEYKRFLENVLKESAEPFTVQEIAAAYGDMRTHYHRMVEQLLPDVADFFLQLDAEQVAQMEKKFESDNRKFVRESLKGTPAERRERRIKKLVEHLESWIGHVSDEQRDLVEARYADLPDYIEERLADRKYRQGQVLAMIRGRVGKEAMVAGLHKLLVDTETWRRPEFTERMRKRDQRMFEMFAALSGTLSADQRSHLQKRIRGFMKDINTLTASR